jgi:hypothetical protein
MHALVSTPRFLLLVDLDSGRVEAVESNRPEYYGISWFPGSSELVLSHSGLNNATLVDIVSLASSEVGYLSRGEEKTEAFLSQPHQILCAHDGKAVVTNTGRNRVQVVDFEIAGQYLEAGLNPVRWDRFGPDGPYGDHLNSVFLRDDKLYVIAHGFKAGSQLLTFAYPKLRLLSASKVPRATGMHNIFVEDDGLMFGCNSEVGGIADLQTGRRLWTSGSPIYTRGLAVSDSSYFIGESEVAVRENRSSCLSGIWVVDRPTLKTRDYLPLGPYGQVHEIRLVDVPDFAHHGTPLAGGVASIKSRLFTVMRAERLRAAGFAEFDSRYWDELSPMVGAALSLGHGWRHALGDLVLSVTREPVASIEVAYRLEDDGSLSHVGIVAGYEGEGDDARMDVFIVQASEGKILFEIWRHAGDDWAKQLSRNVKGLPLEGMLSVVQEGTNATVSVNDLTIGTYELQRPAPSKMGIRSMNAYFRPPNKDRLVGAHPSVINGMDDSIIF